VWSALDGAAEDSLVAHSAPVRSSDVYGEHIITGADDGTLVIWSIEQMKDKFLLQHHTAPITQCSYLHQGLAVLSSSEDGTLVMWDAEFGELDTVMGGHAAPVRGFCISPDGRSVASFGDGGVVIVWDSASCEQQSHISLRGAPSIGGCTLSRGVLLVGCSDGLIVQCDPLSGTQKDEPFGSHHGAVNSVRFSADGLFVCTVGTDKAVMWWSKDGVMLGSMPLDATPTGLFSSNGQALAVGDDMGCVQLFEQPAASKTEQAQSHGVSLSEFERGSVGQDPLVAPKKSGRPQSAHPSRPMTATLRARAL
jgi:WD40 repeat protein